MTRRNDDISALIQNAEREATGTRTAKVLQNWTGGVAFHTERGGAVTVMNAITAKTERKNSPWIIHSVAGNGDNWFAFRASYKAKGANANDAEKLVRSVAGTTELLEVAVDSDGIIPVPTF